ncbi:MULTISPECIES: hypothetical protein [Shewanella]|nr:MULTISPECIES: hypothetical protein [Shewanella]
MRSIQLLCARDDVVVELESLTARDGENAVNAWMQLTATLR